jgi:hypothetical protein
MNKNERSEPKGKKKESTNTEEARQWEAQSFLFVLDEVMVVFSLH